MLNNNNNNKCNNISKYNNKINFQKNKNNMITNKIFQKITKIN